MREVEAPGVEPARRMTRKPSDAPTCTVITRVLSFLPDDIRTQLVVTDGPSGRGGNSYHSAAKGVAKMLVEMSQAGEVEIAVLDVRRLTLNLEGQGQIEPGSQYGCGLYRFLD